MLQRGWNKIYIREMENEIRKFSRKCFATLQCSQKSSSMACFFLEFIIGVRPIGCINIWYERSMQLLLIFLREIKVLVFSIKFSLLAVDVLSIPTYTVLVYCCFHIVFLDFLQRKLLSSIRFHWQLIGNLLQTRSFLELILCLLEQTC